MIAFFKPTQSNVCPTCRQSPCIDGTACVGNGRIVGIIVLSSPAPSVIIQEPRLFLERDHSQPRSPRKSFKKSSKK